MLTTNNKYDKIRKNAKRTIGTTWKYRRVMKNEEYTKRKNY